MASIYVVGSVNQDIVVTLKRQPQPGETVFGETVAYFPGGKGANQALAAQLAGGQVRYQGRVGKDPFGTNMIAHLKRYQLDGEMQVSETAPTGMALITVDEKGENAIVVVSGANAEVEPQDATALANAKEGDLLLLQNEIPLATTCALLRRGRELGLITLFNAAPALALPRESWAHLDLVIVNEHEFAQFYGKTIPTKLAPEQLIDWLAAQGPHRPGLVLTLSARGAIAQWRQEWVYVEGQAAEVVDTTGAGDCFTGYFAAALARGDELEEALRVANRAASLSVTRLGAAASFPKLSDL